MLVCFVVLSASSLAQTNIINRAQANADIDSAVMWISGAHPDMYAVCPKTTFDDSIAAVRASLPEKMSSREFFVKLAPCVAMLGDGHTTLSYTSSAAVLSFPFEVSVNSADSTLTFRGTDQILSINGIPYRSVVAEMLRCYSGERTAFRLTRMESNFVHIFPAVYPAENYRVEYRRGDNTNTETFTTVPDNKVQGRLYNNSTVLYSYKVDEAKSAVIFEFNHFTDRDKFKPFLDSMFREMKEKKINNLIIDIRNNGGGSSGLGDELLRYLSPVPFRQYDKYLVRVSRFARAQNHYVNSKDGLVTIKPKKIVPFKERDRHYGGNTYLLESASTFSSAADFAWTFKQLNIGTVIGEESGGIAVNFGDMLALGALPNSGLNLASSYKKFYGTGAKESDTHGALPDIQIPATQALEYILNRLAP